MATSFGAMSSVAGVNFWDSLALLDSLFVSPIVNKFTTFKYNEKPE